MADATNVFALADGWIIDDETPADAACREELLDRVMGSERFLKSSEVLRRGRSASTDLSLVARMRSGRLVGTVRLWNVNAGEIPALLLGPLAVDQSFAGMGIGTGLMGEALSRARSLDHGAVILVGDPAYYVRFGFSAELTTLLTMPGDFDQSRLLALELHEGWLRGARGPVAAPQEWESLAA
ncbi:N-acetyltransferase [Agrobacterium rubi]|nr:N-acetyltransferase [Agrobacterium rubi]NTF23972.1 N-acetyltransferase [Agrobacterium rubi]